MAALGGHCGFGVAIDGMGFDSEEVLGLWGGLFGADVVLGAFFGGYGGIDPHW